MTDRTGVPACWLMVVMMCVAVGCQSTQPVDRRTPPSERVFSRVRSATVEVLVAGRLDGSGWLATADGYIVTADHVVHGRGENLEIISPLVGRLPARVVAVDRGHDLALLKIAAAQTPYPFLTLAAHSPPVDTAVYCIGTPQFRHGLMLRGSVARSIPAYEAFVDFRKYVRGYYVAGASPPGTSGGCWVDSAGRVVGNQAGLINLNGAPVGIATVAPVEAIEQLVRLKRTIVTATLNVAVEELWEKDVKTIARYPQRAAGVLPVKVYPGGAAARAGLKSDMLITAVDGKATMYRDDLLNYVRGKKPGDVVTLYVQPPDGAARSELRIVLEQL